MPLHNHNRGARNQWDRQRYQRTSYRNERSPKLVWCKALQQYVFPQWYEEILLADPKRIDKMIETTKSVLTRDALAYLILKKSGANPPNDGILMRNHYEARYRREIYTNAGKPDAALVSGMYWRTHPQGRKVNDTNKRKDHGLSFYK